MNVEIQPYFAEGERYPALIGVRVEGDEYETAYVSKVELVDALAENAKLRELAKSLLASHDKMCTQRGNCFGCKFFTTEPCPFVKLSQALRELEIEVE